MNGRKEAIPNEAMRVRENGKSKCSIVINEIGINIPSRKTAHFHLVCYHEKFVNASNLEITEDMNSKQPIIYTTAGRNVSKIMPIHFDKWQLIDWEQAIRIVKKLQRRIVKAVKAGNWKKVRDLQRLLNNSTAAKALAVRRVTENKGKRTAGIDKVLWQTPESKAKAISNLASKGYKAKPVRRVKIRKTNGKWRPLGIPTMKDRAMQALYLLALDPVSETLADWNSYGFRPFRSCADAIRRCYRLLYRKESPTWILEGDIKGCFGNISREWLMDNIPIDKGILNQLLTSGYYEKQSFFPTKDGTPQGSIISPTLANMVLDGMEDAIDQALNIKHRVKHGRYLNPYRIHLIRYADDFIITSTDKDVLEQKVKPIIQKFLSERGLTLSEEKTHLTHIDDGFDFLGQNIRKYKGKLLTKPSKKSIKSLLKKIKEVIHKNRTVKAVQLIYQLNPIIRGWAIYHRHIVAKKTFYYVDYKIYWMIWKWAKRRHPNKNTAWVLRKYYTSYKGTTFTFHAYDEKLLIPLVKAGNVKIQRHTKIRGGANPYDAKDELYFENRSDRSMINKLDGRKLMIRLYKRQDGRCLHCNQKITKQSGWNAHHLTPKHLGGSYTAKNLVLLHPVCHRQVHARHIQFVLPHLNKDVKQA